MSLSITFYGKAKRCDDEFTPGAIMLKFLLIIFDMCSNIWLISLSLMTVL